MFFVIYTTITGLWNWGYFSMFGLFQVYSYMSNMIRYVFR